MVQVGPFKFKGELLLLGVVIFCVLSGHLWYSCCNTPKWPEGFEDKSRNPVELSAKKKEAQKVHESRMNSGKAVASSADTTTDSSATTTTDTSATTTTDTSATTDSTTTTTTEGFVGQYASPFSPDFASTAPAKTTEMPPEWSSVIKYPGMTSTESQGYIGDGNFFKNISFKPDCCPNTFSSSTGCACMNVGTYNTLRQRAGNNYPYSQW